MNEYIKNFIRCIARVAIKDEELAASNGNTALRYSTPLSNFLATIFLEKQGNKSMFHCIDNILEYTNSKGELYKDKKSIMNFYKKIAEPLDNKLTSLINGDIKTLVTLIGLYEDDSMDGHLIAGVFKYEEQVIKLYLADTIYSGIEATKKIMEQIMSSCHDSVGFKVHTFPALADIKSDIDTSNDCGLYAIELAKTMSTELSYDQIKEKMQLLPTTKEIKIEHYKEKLSYLKKIKVCV